MRIELWDVDGCRRCDGGQGPVCGQCRRELAYDYAEDY